MSDELTVRLSVSYDLPSWSDRVDEGRLVTYVERVLQAEGVTGPIEMSLLFTDDETIRSLNARYRRVDASTDVLSFAQDDAVTAEGFVTPPGAPRILGDVVISLPQAERQASDYGHSLGREISYLIVHGTLHLLGYDHETEADRAEMRKREEAALFDIPRGAASAED